MNLDKYIDKLFYEEFEEYDDYNFEWYDWEEKNLRSAKFLNTDIQSILHVQSIIHNNAQHVNLIKDW